MKERLHIKPLRHRRIYRQSAEAASQAPSSCAPGTFRCASRSVISAYSPGWGGWRGQHDDLLAALFPMVQEGDE